MVGILLPPSVPGALVNFASLLAGKVPVNLNYTLSAATLASCIQQCQIETVVTSEAFLSRLKLTVPCQTVFIEEVSAKPGVWEQLIALLMTWLLPVRVLERAMGHTEPAGVDDLATVIFSSGSTGEPKGVMLTHYNIAANVEQLGQTFALGGSDRMLGILPFLSLVRVHRHAVSAGDIGGRRRVPSHAPRRTRHRRPGQGICRDISAGDAYFPPDLSSRVCTRAVRQRADSHGRGRAVTRPRCQRLRGGGSGSVPWRPTGVLSAHRR